MKLQQRLTSFLLCLVIMITGLVGYIPGSATDALLNESQSIADTQMRSETLLGSTIIDSNIALNENAAVGSEKIQLPDIVKEDINASQFIGRSPAKETNLNTFVFKNQDGTQTMKVYSHPVKYIDEKGKVQDISTDIKLNSNGTFETKANSIKTVFSKELKDGITLQANNVNIRLVSDKATDGKLSDDKKAVIYQYDNKTTIEYSLTYTGFKEDIVVNEYTGQTEYEFTLYTNGLTLVKENGSYFLQDRDGKVQATIGDIIIFTADERNNTFGDMTHETITANQEYVITIHVDSAYLKDSKTKYPIRIDPTIEINYDEDGAGAIEDVTINSNAGSSGSSGSVRIGLRETYGISRLLMKFPNLDLSRIASDSDVLSASVEMRDIMCESAEMLVYCYPFTGNVWSEDTASWTNVNYNSYGSLLSSRIIGYEIGDEFAERHRYSFNITNAVKGWINGSLNIDKGIIFKASNSIENGSTYISKTFASYNRSSNKPSLSISFAGKVSLTASTISLVKGSSCQLNSVTSDPAVLSWLTSDSNIATVDSTGKVTGHKTGKATITVMATFPDSTTAIDSCTVYIRLADGIYNIKNVKSGYYLTAYPFGNNYTRMELLKDQASLEAIRQLWKITYAGEGCYRIKPMVALETITNNSSSEFLNFIKDGSTIDPWRLMEGPDGYTVTSPNNSNNKWQLNNNVYYTANVIIGVEGVTNEDTSLWDMQPVTNVSSELLLYNIATGDLLVEPKKFIIIDECKDIKEFKISVAVVDPNNNSQSVNWRVKADNNPNNDNCVVVDSQTGEITAVSPGCVTIEAYKQLQGSEKTIEYTIEVLAVKNGFYFIENGHYEEMLQINDDYAPEYNVNGCITELLPIDGGIHQRWEFQSLDNGYYRITSAISNMALTVPVQANESDNEELNIIQTEYTGGENQQWKIELNSNGKYIIRARSVENLTTDFVLSSQLTTIENPNVQQMAYTNNSNYRDEWYLRPAKIELINVYDNSFLRSYDVNGKQYYSLIDKVNITITDVFKTLFKMDVLKDGDAIHFEDALQDMCSGDIDDLCRCDSSHPHRNIYMIYDQLEDVFGEPGHVCVSWSNRDEWTYCQHESNGDHVNLNVAGIVFKHKPIIQILNIDRYLWYDDSTHTLKYYALNEIEIELFMTRLLAHELVHTFEMPDIYNDNNHPNNDTGACIMNTADISYFQTHSNAIFPTGIDYNSVFCPYCLESIDQYIAKYFVGLYQ